MADEPQQVDSAKDTAESGPTPVATVLLSYPKNATLEQRVSRLERLMVLFIILAMFMAFACLGMIWAFLTAFKVI